MAKNTEREMRQPLTKEEKQARLIGISPELDEEDIVFWRNASEKLRGRTLYKLLRRGHAMRSSFVHADEDTVKSPRLPNPPRNTIENDE